MPTQYTPILKLALPVEGELTGTWGDVVNDSITSMIEQAIAGLATISTWTANSHTLTTANGSTSESRCAILVATDGSGGTALTGNGEIICPAASKIYIVRNYTSFWAITLKTASGSGVTIPYGFSAILYCDGTDVVSANNILVNSVVSGNLTPFAGSVSSLGNNLRRFQDLWVNNCYVDQVNATNVDATTKLEAPNVETTTIKHTNGTTAATIDTGGNVTFSNNLTASNDIEALSGIFSNVNGTVVVTVGDTNTSDYYQFVITSGKLVVYNSASVAVMSINSAGNMVLKGTLTQNGTP